MYMKSDISVKCDVSIRIFPCFYRDIYLNSYTLSNETTTFINFLHTKHLYLKQIL